MEARQARASWSKLLSHLKQERVLTQQPQRKADIFAQTKGAVRAAEREQREAGEEFVPPIAVEWRPLTDAKETKKPEKVEMMESSSAVERVERTEVDPVELSTSRPEKIER